MTLLYAIPALYNLGGFKIPETPWSPADKNDGFVVDLGREVEVAKVMLYQGYNEEKYDGTKFNIKFLNSNGTYSESETLEKSGFFSWKVSTKEFKTSKIQITADKSGAAINELAIFEKGSNKPFEVKNITPVEQIANSAGKSPDGKAYKLSNLLDEQDRVDFYTLSSTSTYFDEVFYPRTALDFIYKVHPFERLIHLLANISL